MQALMHWVGLLLIVVAFLREAPSCRMPHGEHMHHVAPHGEKYAVFSVPFAMKQNPDFFTIGVGIRVDRAAVWFGTE